MVLLLSYSQAELGDDFPIGDTVARGHDLSPDMSKMPLLIQVREYDHKYVLTAEYRSDMYSEAFVRGMLESYEAAMDSLLKAHIYDRILLPGSAEASLTYPEKGHGPWQQYHRSGNHPQALPDMQIPDQN